MGDEVERKGLCTHATRADVIEKLVMGGFVKREYSTQEFMGGIRDQFSSF